MAERSPLLTLGPHTTCGRMNFVTFHSAWTTHDSVNCILIVVAVKLRLTHSTIHFVLHLHVVLPTIVLLGAYSRRSGVVEFLSV